MLILAVGLFAIAALVGATMAVMHSLGKTPPPVALAVLHGVLAASGLVVLLLGVWHQFSGRAVWALGFLFWRRWAALRWLWVFTGAANPFPPASWRGTARWR